MAKGNKKKYSPNEIAALMVAFDRSYLTITRWVANNDDRLTSDKAKEALMSAKIKS